MEQTPAFNVLIGDIRFLLEKARHFKNIAHTLEVDSESFNLLLSVAFEIYPKVLFGIDICLENKGKTEQEVTCSDIKQKIVKTMQSLGHNLAHIYKRSSNLFNYLNLEDVQESNPDNGFVWQYVFVPKELDYLVIVKNVEAARYFSFAKRGDSFRLCTNNKNTIDMLDRIDKFVLNKYQEARTELLQK